MSFSKRVPELIIYSGPMWGSKTTRLIASIERLKLQGRKVIAYKPSLDSRYADDFICTHSGAKWPAHCVSSGSALLRHLETSGDNVDAVAIDEAFMTAQLAAYEGFGSEGRRVLGFAFRSFHARDDAESDGQRANGN